MGSYSLLATVNLETSDPRGVDGVSAETKKKKEDGGEEKSEEVNEEMRRSRGEKKQSQSCFCCREIGVKVSLV